MKRLVLFLFINSFTSLVFGGESCKEKLYDYYVTENMVAWKHYLIYLEQTPDPAPDSILWQRLEAEYGYIGWAISSLSEEERELVVESHLEKSFDTLEKLEKRGLFCSNLEAYRSAFYAYKIPIATYKAPKYGPKSGRAANKAISLDINNPFAYIQSGHVAVYTPIFFGGSKEEAIAHYLRAVKLFEENSSDSYHNWLYLHALTSLAMAYDIQEEYMKSVLIYEKVLRIAPDFKWIKEDLYPKALQHCK